MVGRADGVDRLRRATGGGRGEDEDVLDVLLRPAGTDEATTTLGTLKLVMGLPLFAPLVAVTWLAVRAVYPPASKAGEPAGS